MKQSHGARSKSVNPGRIFILKLPARFPGPFNLYEETKRLAWLGIDLFERYRLDFSFKPYAETDYEDLRRPFMRNVHSEGVEL